MKIAFTGTRDGMDEWQLAQLIFHLGRIDGTSDDVVEFHHGDCVGADEESHDIVTDLRSGGLLQGRIVIHPPVSSAARAFLRGDECRPKLDYLDRNRAMVDECDMLIAAPKTNTEEIRSGTWATVRHAKLTSKPVVILERE